MRVPNFVGCNKVAQISFVDALWTNICVGNHVSYLEGMDAWVYAPKYVLFEGSQH